MCSASDDSPSKKHSSVILGDFNYTDIYCKSTKIRRPNKLSPLFLLDLFLRRWKKEHEQFRFAILDWTLINGDGLAEEVKEIIIWRENELSWCPKEKVWSDQYTWVQKNGYWLLQGKRDQDNSLKSWEKSVKEGEKIPQNEIVKTWLYSYHNAKWEKFRPGWICTELSKILQRKRNSSYRKQKIDLLLKKKKSRLASETLGIVSGR